MKKKWFYPLLGILFLSLSAFAFHKFYVGVFQVEYAAEKKMIQITSRIFIDDLNNAMEKKYHKKTFVGTEKETQADLDLFKKYLAENFTIKINGQTKPITFLSKEVEAGDVLVCYSRIKDIDKFKTIEISNTILVDWNGEQQNITHISAFGTKRSVLFTESSTKELLKY
ncbi:DUF6702 family protein [Flavobacterium johnsoniae]|uniref:Peptidase E n=1 Tax=Flavobacterium johnsoniae (strain ATCC 17061 / DSM 2064 / JCM 8514 / BCRC 14874 / CCUG 350202 / NBRC 14942 / NCIMB 11054 / UW101) TaxID=376686 RepID=A5FJ09_FLAJ1|nr:DUF6702 family protein [Flavobacterium johnsoniae]ABQ04804.1 hypothetical protein Fjoh_1772 [Flavobacterium johnsoniae UW101]OXG02994.1 hypothetical protein B0A63_01705 [Flavobacterium johnsoniae UW101]WQG83398.1 DUF6702 family protein [Flavobacterium johnsoniae UW101]SHK34598.1 hypothetical protein SAMN05444146_1219 [Flavobacterium johnsoniae]